MTTTIIGVTPRKVDLVIVRGIHWDYDFTIQYQGELVDITTDEFTGAARLNGEDDAVDYEFEFEKLSPTLVRAKMVGSVSNQMPVGEDFNKFPYDWIWNSTLFNTEIPIYRGHVKLLRKYTP